MTTPLLDPFRHNAWATKQLQVCTILTDPGIQPPVIDGWAFGEASGRTQANPQV